MKLAELLGQRRKGLVRGRIESCPFCRSITVSRNFQISWIRRLYEETGMQKRKRIGARNCSKRGDLALDSRRLRALQWSKKEAESQLGQASKRTLPIFPPADPNIDLFHSDGEDISSGRLETLAFLRPSALRNRRSTTSPHASQLPWATSWGRRNNRSCMSTMI
jgi:hypothetical protein